MEKAFVDLKACLTTAPILSHYRAKRQYIVKIYASDFALGAGLSQKGSDDKLHPIAYHSGKCSPSEINYEIHDKELLVVVHSFTVG
jgi:hypothetical protein